MEMIRVRYIRMLCLYLFITACGETTNKQSSSASAQVQQNTGADKSIITQDTIAKEDTSLYQSKLWHLVHNKPGGKWPAQSPRPLAGAILPYKRIVAYYGNFYSKNMGILGQVPPDEMIKRLNEEVKKWEKADTLMPVVPAIHYIAVTAQHNPGKGSKYRLRMPFSQVDKALELAKKIDGILFLDVQVGLSTLEEELPLLEPYLKLPNVHLAIDAEYSMKDGQIPCSTIGTFDAEDLNYASAYLAELVHKYNIPPKVLIVHRFTKPMLTNYKKVITRPEVQIVMNMDGFGFPAKKISSYKLAIVNEPVQFAGFKLFYKYDVLSPKWRTLMQPEDVLKLYPSPVYIQYQ